MIDRCLRYFLLFSISAILIIAPIENARANLSLVVPVVRASAPRFQHAIAKVLQDKVLSIVTAGVDSGAIVNGPEVVVATRVAQTAALSDMVASGASVAAGGLLAIGGAPVWLGVLASAGIGLGVGYIASDYFDIAFDKDSSPPVPANPPAPPSVTPSIAPKDSLGQGSPFKMPVMIDYAFPPFVSYNFAPAPLVVSSVYPEATFFDIAALPNPFVALTPNDLSKLPFSYKYYSDIGTKRFYFSDFADLYNGVGSYLNESLAANKFSFPADLNLYYSDNYSGVMGSPLVLNNLYGLGVPRNLSGIKHLIGDPSAKTICTTGCYSNVNRLDFTPVDVFLFRRTLRARLGLVNLSLVISLRIPSRNLLAPALIRLASPLLITYQKSHLLFESFTLITVVLICSSIFLFAESLRYILVLITKHMLLITFCLTLFFSLVLIWRITRTSFIYPATKKA